MSDYPAGTVLGAWPVDLGSLPLDQTDEYGVDWMVTNLTGWGSAAQESEPQARADGIGANAAPATTATKEYVLAGSAEAETPAERWDAEQRLMAAAAGEVTLVLRDEVPRRATVRQTGPVEITRTSVYTFEYEVSLLALDPRRYSLTEHRASTTFPSTVGGLTIPATVPLTIDATVATGMVSVHNAGNAPAKGRYRIDGPVAGPFIRDTATGRTLRTSLTLAAGEWIEVDTRTRQAFANGDRNASRTDKFYGDWFPLAPGTTTLAFGGISGSTEAQFGVGWFDTWK